MFTGIIMTEWVRYFLHLYNVFERTGLCSLDGVRQTFEPSKRSFLESRGFISSKILNYKNVKILINK